MCFPDGLDLRAVEPHQAHLRRVIVRADRRGGADDELLRGNCEGRGGTIFEADRGVEKIVGRVELKLFHNDEAVGELLFGANGVADFRELKRRGILQQRGAEQTERGHRRAAVQGREIRRVLILLRATDRLGEARQLDALEATAVRRDDEPRDFALERERGFRAGDVGENCGRGRGTINAHRRGSRGRRRGRGGFERRADGVRARRGGRRRRVQFVDEWEPQHQQRERNDENDDGFAVHLKNSFRGRRARAIARAAFVRRARRHGIMPATTPRLTAREPAHRKPNARHPAVAANRRDRVRRARGRETTTARRAKQRGEHGRHGQLVHLQQRD